jgi:hypothetical protein
MAKIGEFGIVEKVRARSAVLLGAGALAVAGLLGGCGGSHKKPVSYAVASHEAEGKYERVFTHSDAAGKFSLQYLRGSSDRQFKDDASSGDNMQWSFTFNDHCLHNTAYDTNGGHISGSVEGFFLFGGVSGSITGNIPATSIVSQAGSNPNDIEVIPDGAHLPTLSFSGAEGLGPLEPTNTITRQILEANGCQVGITAVATIDIDSPAY